MKSLLDKADAVLAKGIPGNDILVYVHGKEALHRPAGWIDTTRSAPMTGDERYNLYSCSKPITCAAALQLWEKGEYGFDTPVSRFIPAFHDAKVATPEGNVKPEREITMYDLFTMTSGITYQTDAPSVKALQAETSGRCPTVRAAEAIAKIPLAFQPGAKWGYGLSHDVLAAVVEIISGMPFQDYVKKNIFAPLGMTRSTFLLPQDELDTVVPQYEYRSGQYVDVGKEIQPYKLGTEYASGGAGCVSTANDYIRFLEALRVGDKILSADTVDRMATPLLTEAQYATVAYKGPYTYGLGVRCPSHESTHTDFGWTGAAGALCAVNKKYGYTLFYVQHVIGGPCDPEREQMTEALEKEIQ